MATVIRIDTAGNATVDSVQLSIDLTARQRQIAALLGGTAEYILFPDQRTKRSGIMAIRANPPQHIPLPHNRIASALTKRDINGPAVMLSPDEAADELLNVQ